ncbi:MAG: lycopene cyclase family protein [Saprospiraceae bacterium]
MENTHFDYVIIGAGAAGLHLCLAMIENSFFSDKRILILEKDSKTKNDRTWCFWEKGKGKWDHLLYRTWKNGYFHSAKFSKKLDLEDYSYKMIRSSQFYQFAKEKINSSSNFFWKKEEVISVENSGKTPKINTVINTYQTSHIFDSRIDKSFFEKKDDFIKLLQPFKGWTIKTKKPSFDTSSFVMMDFRLRWKDRTSFTYVLPLSKTEAMIEFTLFNKHTLTSGEFDNKLKQYISEILKVEEYEILEEEVGVIPMTDFPFHKKNNNTLTKIGTAGGWVKPSSGYAFKNCEKYAQTVIENIIANRLPSYQLFKTRYRWYDSIMLNILWNKNELGTSLFVDMFENNDVIDIFKFLDDEGNLISDISIMRSFNPFPFLTALFRKYLPQKNTN